MKSFDIGKASFALMEQFIVEAKLTYYEAVKVVRVSPSEDNPGAYEVVFHSYDDSSYHDTVTVETLDLLAYIALKTGITGAKD